MWICRRLRLQNLQLATACIATPSNRQTQTDLLQKNSTKQQVYFNSRCVGSLLVSASKSMAFTTGLIPWHALDLCDEDAIVERKLGVESRDLVTYP
jgi:hypothetical protein